MSKLKKISHIILALFLAALAGGLVWYYINANSPSVKVVVASKNLPIGTVLGSQNVTVKTYPASVVPQDAQTSMDSVAGKTVVSGKIFSGEVIRKGHIAADTGSLKAALASIAPGREAMDLPAETSAELRGVKVGDKVNVYTEVTVDKDTTVVDCIAREAIVIDTPQSGSGESSLASVGSEGGKGAYVIAFTPAEAKLIADGIVRGKKFSVALLPARG